MLATKIYPRTAIEFRQLCLDNSKFNNYYHILGQPKPFDVTLRDGLQCLTEKEQKLYTTSKKMDLYHKIKLNYQPSNIEIGSVISDKVLPIFKDSIYLFQNIQLSENNINDINKIQKPNTFLLVPNYKQLQNIINYKNIHHLSLITSVSNNFQLKNTKQTLEDSDKEIYEMIHCFEKNKFRNHKPFIKLYVSCINECPIVGKIDNDYIVNRLLHINKMDVDDICLSDTCGSLNDEDFEYIIDTSRYFGMLLNKLSLHLHVKKGSEDMIEKIIHKALDNKIINFDVSLLETGGCSVTIDKKNIAPNLSYELYYKSLVNYINKKINL